MSNSWPRAIALPVSLGAAASVAIFAVYLAIVALAQGWEPAIQLLAQDWYLVAPITLSFGVQIGLYVYLRGIIRVRSRGTGAITGASGGTSTMAMVACCAHRVADLLPFLGLSAAAGFLAAYKTPFLIFGLAVSLTGVFLISRRIVKYRVQHLRDEYAGGKVEGLQVECRGGSG